MKIGGEDKDIMIVIGNDVDVVTLTHALFKKFGGTTLVRVESFMSYQFGQDDDQAAASKIYGQPKYYGNYYGQTFSYYNPPQQYPPQYYYPCDRPVDNSGCSIM